MATTDVLHQDLGWADPANQSTLWADPAAVSEVQWADPFAAGVEEADEESSDIEISISEEDEPTEVKPTKAFDDLGAGWAEAIITLQNEDAKGERRRIEEELEEKRQSKVQPVPLRVQKCCVNRDLAFRIGQLPEKMNDVEFRDVKIGEAFVRIYQPSNDADPICPDYILATCRGFEAGDEEYTFVDLYGKEFETNLLLRVARGESDKLVRLDSIATEGEIKPLEWDCYKHAINHMLEGDGRDPVDFDVGRHTAFGQKLAIVEINLAKAKQFYFTEEVIEGMLEDFKLTKASFTYREAFNKVKSLQDQIAHCPFNTQRMKELDKELDSYMVELDQAREHLEVNRKHFENRASIWQVTAINNLQHKRQDFFDERMARHSALAGKDADVEGGPNPFARHECLPRNMWDMAIGDASIKETLSKKVKTVKTEKPVTSSPGKSRPSSPSKRPTQLSVLNIETLMRQNSKLKRMVNDEVSNVSRSRSSGNLQKNEESVTESLTRIFGDDKSRAPSSPSNGPQKRTYAVSFGSNNALSEKAMKVIEEARAKRAKVAGSVEATRSKSRQRSSSTNNINNNPYSPRGRTYSNRSSRNHSPRHRSNSNYNNNRW